VIEAKGLVQRFGSFTAVDGIDVRVESGEAFGFLGPNGAGKSSTMRMIGAVSPPTAGYLRVLGSDPNTEGPAIRARIGVVPQEDMLDTELSVADNLLIYGRYFDLPVRELRPWIARLLEFMQLADRARDRVDPLSGGMKRRGARRRRAHGGPPPSRSPTPDLVGLVPARVCVAPSARRAVRSAQLFRAT